MSNQTGSKVKVLSLFTGAGGLDIGFHKAGFEIAACVEVEPVFSKTLILNKLAGKYLDLNCVIYNEDITTFDPAPLGNASIDFIIGGPPCQTYSASGRRIGGAAGLDDERGRLFEHYCRILDYLQPKGFLFENVRGLLGVNKGAAWEAVKAAFSELGYELYHELLDAAAYGVPQHRERIFLVGIKTGQAFQFPYPLYGPDSVGNISYITAGQVLADLQDPAEPYHIYDGKYGHLLGAIPEGMNYSYYTAERGHPAPVFAWRSKFSSFLYKVAQDQPIKTLQAQLGKFAGPFHWKNRRFSVAELKRLQSFPDDYSFAGSYNTISEQIGNSVPPKLASYLGQAVMKQVFDKQAFPELDLMPEHFKQSFDARKARVAAITKTVTQATRVESSLQMSLWDSVQTTRPNTAKMVASYERFVYSYTTPTNRRKIDTEKAVEMLESSNAKSNALGQQLFSVDVCFNPQLSSLLQVEVGQFDFTTQPTPIWQLTLNLQTPLSDGTNQIEARLHSNDYSHIFALWDTVEEAIKQRSAYFSLVGLYGHFAEPRPKFSLNLTCLSPDKPAIARLIEYCSIFSNCGRSTATHTLAKYSQVEEDQIPLLMRELRNIRYDVRSNQTSSRIAQGHYFCAYPFPELSAAYQVNKTV